MEIIRVEKINKTYRDKTVLKDISFEMKEGSCVGILGGNGSGKTTLLSILAGIIRADSGSFFYGDRDLLKGSGRKQGLVGLIPQSNPLIEELSAWDNLLLWYRRDCLRRELTDGVAGMLGIGEFLNKPVRKLSGGMKKRLSIACAVARKPRILLMDEPTAALDMDCREIIYAYILEHTKRGGSVMLVTHDMGELDLCSRHFLLKESILKEFQYNRHI